MAVQSSSNRVTRLLGIDADPVNHGWLCDKGRFAFEAVNSDDRLTEPLVRKDGALVAGLLARGPRTRWPTGLQQAAVEGRRRRVGRRHRAAPG